MNTTSSAPTLMEFRVSSQQDHRQISRKNFSAWALWGSVDLVVGGILKAKSTKTFPRKKMYVHNLADIDIDNVDKSSHLFENVTDRAVY